MTRDEIALKFLASMLTRTPALQSSQDKADIVTAAFQWANAFLSARDRLSEESLKDIVVPLR